ncbi:MAG: DUF5103 domain-containing protein [Bacteroidales bacterium]|jgi:hypothetical protein|nr:DUF5103 domain-containing protein [Bacteroidales bacterium]
MKHFLFILLIFLFYSSIFAHNFKSIAVKSDGFLLGKPVIKLGSNEKINISFDELNEYARNLQYKIVHCNADWLPSNLPEIRVYEGGLDNSISDVSFSFNTHIDYVHYELKFPDDYTKITVSGNYKLEIYDFSESNEALFEVKFYVSEDNADVFGKILQAKGELRQLCHDLTFTVSPQKTSIDFDRIDKNYRFFLQQNGRTDDFRRIYPSYTNDNGFVFNYNDDLLFYAGNEFRNFDLRSVENNLQSVEKISLEDDYYHILLRKQKSDASKAYSGNDDINGEYVTYVNNKWSPQLEAEYCEVYFVLESAYLGNDADVYVLGGLSNWEFSDENVMDYDFEHRCYIASLLLKQGFYDYCFAVLPKGETIADITYFEGSHYETHNNYTLYVYYRSMFDDCDRLLAVKTIGR